MVSNCNRYWFRTRALSARAHGIHSPKTSSLEVTHSETYATLVKLDTVNFVCSMVIPKAKHRKLSMSPNLNHSNPNPNVDPTLKCHPYIEPSKKICVVQRKLNIILLWFFLIQVKSHQTETLMLFPPHRCCLTIDYFGISVLISHLLYFIEFEIIKWPD